MTKSQMNFKTQDAYRILTKVAGYCIKCNGIYKSRGNHPYCILSQLTENPIPCSKRGEVIDIDQKKYECNL